MTLYEKWQERYGADDSEKGQNDFWQEYFLKEQGVYKIILGEKIEVLSGTLAELATRFALDSTTFIGFLDGINTSLETKLDIETLKEEDQLELKIIIDRLYYNMLEAKADWLYNLEEWDELLTIDERKAIKKKFNEEHIARKTINIGRNDPCHCGSGKKYKKCCLQKDEA